MPIDVFISYSHSDETLYQQLANHLKPLEYDGTISPWSDHRITPGQEFDTEIMAALDRAKLILLLISSDFIASDYCWGTEMKKALARHAEGSARVVPIILRPADWRRGQLSKLVALPKDGEAVTTWGNSDQAFVDIAISLRRAVADLIKPPEQARTQPPITESPKTEQPKTTLKADAEIYPLTPPRAEMQGDATVSLNFIRRFHLVRSNVAYKVFADGSEVAKISENETVSFTLRPGTHNIQLKRLWLQSAILTIEAKPDETTYLECQIAVFDSSISIPKRLAGSYGIGDSVTLRRKS